MSVGKSPKDTARTGEKEEDVMRTFMRIAWRAGCLLLAMVLVWLSMGMSAAAAEEEIIPSDEPVEIAELAPDVTLPCDRVTLVADGSSEEFSAELGTVENLLKVAGVELGEYDVVRPSASEALEGGTEVEIEAVPYEDEVIIKCGEHYFRTVADFFHEYRLDGKRITAYIDKILYITMEETQ